MDSTNQKAKTVKRVVSRLLKAITKETKSYESQRVAALSL